MRLGTIQALRAFAAYLVVFYHIRGSEKVAIEANGGSESPLIGGSFTNGFAGVDLFFVISGFIMVYVTALRPESPGTVKDFLLARIFRIYPPWWVFAGFMATYLFIAYGVPWDAATLSANGNNGPNHLIRSFLLLPQQGFPILGVGWTLIHEMYFYLIFALLLFAPRKLLPAWLGVWALLVIGGAIAGKTAIYARDIPSLVFHPMTLEFILGGLMGWVFVSGVRFRPLALLILGSVSMMIALAIHPSPTPFTLKWGRVLYFALPCALMVYGAAGLGEHFKGTIAKWAERLGDWSYSLYLSHVLVIAGTSKAMSVFANILQVKLSAPESVANMFRLGAPGIADNLIFTVLAVTGATIVSALSFYLIERPTLKFLNRFRDKPEKAPVEAPKREAPSREKRPLPPW